MSKELFQLMREQEVQEAYPTKKQAESYGLKLAKKIIDEGKNNIFETHAEALRIRDFATALEKELRSKLPQEKSEAFGLKIIYKSGGDIKNYTEDPVYKELKGKLDSRKALLDLALKSNETFYDSEGIEVPRVSTTPKKSSLNISY